MGRVPVRDVRGVRRGVDLAVPVRQVRLDHTVERALREAVAAARLAAVPLRSAVRDPRAPHGARHPQVVDGGGGHQGGRLPLRRHVHGVDRGGRARGRAAHPHLPTPHHGSRLPRDDAHGQDHVRVPRGVDPARVVGDRADAAPRRRPRVRLPGDDLPLVPLALVPPAAACAHGGRARGVPAPHRRRQPAVHPLAVHAAVHAFSAPAPYLFRPYVVYRSREASVAARAPRPGWDPSERPRGR